MQPSEVNQFLITLTIVVASIAFLLIFYSYCHYKCGLCQRKPKRTTNVPEVRITMHNDSKTPLSVDCSDIDFIDSRNTNLISSTVRVTSVHNAPPQI